MKHNTNKPIDLVESAIKGYLKTCNHLFVTPFGSWTDDYAEPLNRDDSDIGKFFTALFNIDTHNNNFAVLSLDSESSTSKEINEFLPLPLKYHSEDSQILILSDFPIQLPDFNVNVIKSVRQKVDIGKCNVNLSDKTLLRNEIVDECQIDTYIYGPV
jgi:hypothetical protein